MHHYWLMLAILTASLAHLAASLRLPWNDTRVKHMWNSIPANWEYLGHPHAGTTINLYIALKSHRENALIDALYEVSDPKHPKYGRHLSKEQVAELVAPHPTTLELVHSWLEHNGVPSSSIATTHGGNWLTVTGVPVSKASELLGASYRLYRHSMTNETIVRTLGYALPTALIPHVLTVAPTTFFASAGTLRKTPRRRVTAVAPAAAKEEASGEPVRMMSNRDDPPPPVMEVKPSTLTWLYKTFTYKPTATDQNGFGIAGFLPEYPSQTDLTRFMKEYCAGDEDATFEVVRVNGGEYNPNAPGIEGNLNTQYASAITYPTPQTWYSIGGTTQVYDDTGEPAPGDVFLEWFNFLSDQPKIPQTISTSYGTDEKDCPLEYAKALCEQFAQLGARGVSVLYASGDDGVGAGDCKDDDGQVHFTPLFPASCPYVTSVGGTTGALAESAAELSGGGFSNIFPRPKYQNKVVPAFLRKFGRRKYAGFYNPKGRGIPDIAGQALGYVIVLNNIFGPVDGTSCAAPTVAGVICLLNDFLITNGKKPLGFLNPWLYSDGREGLNDILKGNNPGCETQGFSAMPGWDPVTGLGTPDFFEMQLIIESTIIQGRPGTSSGT